MTSDRFLNPIFREFYKERDVILEERRLGVETQPTGKLMEDFMAVAFKSHPYHHEVVGHMSDLQSITRNDVEDYFKKYYSPCNLTVGIVGDVMADEVFKLAETYFSPVPSGPQPAPIRTKEPEQWGERRVAVAAKPSPSSSSAITCLTPGTKTARLSTLWPTSSARAVPRDYSPRSSKTRRSPP